MSVVPLPSVGCRAFRAATKRGDSRKALAFLQGTSAGTPTVSLSRKARLRGFPVGPSGPIRPSHHEPREAERLSTEQKQHAVRRRLDKRTVQLVAALGRLT